MKIAVRYYTKGGNTKKLADAAAQEAGVRALPVTDPLTEDTDILFLCDSVYWAGVDGAVRQFLQAPGAGIGRVVNISTAALVTSSYAQVQKLCERAGLTLAAEEFHCKGSFAMLHKGKPDDADIKAVRAFVRKVLGDAQ